MEKEAFFSGYCRMLDQSRMVCVCAENGQLTEADCNFAHCPYTAECPVAGKIQEFIQSV